MCALDPIPVQWLADRAMERQSSGQGECKQPWKEELVSSLHLVGSKEGEGAETTLWKGL